MADFIKTISNSLNLFGNGPSTKWGQSFGYPYTMVWGTSTWGEGYSLVIDIEKIITNSITPDSAFYLETNKLISNDLSLSFETSDERLYQGDWSYVFSFYTSDAEDRDFPTWTEGSASSVSFTCGSAGSTTWT